MRGVAAHIRANRCGPERPKTTGGDPEARRRVVYRMKQIVIAGVSMGLGAAAAKFLTRAGRRLRKRWSRTRIHFSPLISAPHIESGSFGD